MKTIITVVLMIITIAIVLKLANNNDKVRNSYFDSRLEECRSLGSNYDMRASGCVDVTNE